MDSLAEVHGVPFSVSLHSVDCWSWHEVPQVDGLKRVAGGIRRERAGHTGRVCAPCTLWTMLYPAVVGTCCRPRMKTMRTIPQATSAYTTIATSEDNSSTLL
jgi:hypothetical protein